MRTLHSFTSAAILRRLAAIDALAAAIEARCNALDPDYHSAVSIRESAQIARDELLRAILPDVAAEPLSPEERTAASV